MRILYIDHYAGSSIHGMEFRPYYLSREWVKQGHQVRILAASFSHLRSMQPDVGRTTGGIETIEGIEYHWYATRAYHGNGIGRALNIAQFLYRLWANARRIAEDFHPDAVIASSTYPMDIWPAQRIARIANARLVFELHDIWPLSLVELGHMSTRHPFVRLCDWAARTAYRQSDLVVSMLPNFGEFLEAIGQRVRRLKIVPNGMNPEEWSGAAAQLGEPLSSFLERMCGDGRLLVGYAGSHGKANALDVLLDAARIAVGQPYVFLLVGDGPEKDRLVARAKAENLDNVFFFPPVPKAQVRALLERLDVAYIGWEPLSMYRFGISPNKLIDYMMAGRLILHSVGAPNDLVEEARCGFCVKPGEPQMVCDALRQIAGLTKEERDAIGARGRHFALRNHAYPVLASRFLEAFG